MPSECVDISEQTLEKLLASCISAQKLSYSPYSKFRVGAALLCNDGTIYTGCNVENVSYGLSICAERTAIVKAVSEGKRNFHAIAITGDLTSTFTFPCGACRQFIIEFGDIVIYTVLPDGTKHYKTTASKLLPEAFVPQNLTNQKPSD